MKVSVHHWRFADGVPVKIEVLSRVDRIMHPTGFRTEPRGWSGWAYVNDDREFEQWMKVNCPTADCTHRFNSGNPMYTIFISNDAEATVFTLKWL